MKTNQDGLSLIKSFEGLRLDAYLDSVGIPTIGYGSTGSDIKLGLKWTKQQAESRLEDDVYKFEKGVEACVKTRLNSNQFSALVCFAYNVGIGSLQKSTLLKKLNGGDTEGAADEFLRWNKAGGKVLAGLTRRREAERALFLKPEVEYISKDVLPDGPSEDEINKFLESIEKGVLK